MIRHPEPTLIARYVAGFGNKIHNEVTLSPGEYQLQAGIPSIIERHLGDEEWSSNGPGAFTVSVEGTYRIITAGGNGACSIYKLAK